LDSFIFDSNEKIALIFGNEVEGVKQEVMNKVDKCIEIPQFGTKHSFNISVSVAIVLWEAAKVYKLDK
jgi:tRNA G18 (ribose-2'-O)-methylase SpoU